MITLAVNRGSSSLKFALFDVTRDESLIFKGELQRLGQTEGAFKAVTADGAVLIDRVDVWSAGTLPRVVAEWLLARPEVRDLGGIGHRIVQGGEQFAEPHEITPDVRSTLSDLRPLAPEHLPAEIETIDSFGEVFHHVPQVACFDTTFHRRMPPAARTYALPPELGVVRYGFHGLSYEYTLGELRRAGEGHATTGRVVIAHLGNGSSMAAVRDGIGVDTTMGFTPAGGLVMGTRSGDLDPGVIVYLLREKKVEVQDLNDLVNHRSGLIAVSGISSDMRELLSVEHDNPRAALAVELYCYQARKFIGALAAGLGGLDTLAFTGGIGANAPAIRKRICEGLEFLGIRTDAGRNAANATVISPDGVAVTVRAMKTDEERMIVRHTARVLTARQQLRHDS